MGGAGRSPHRSHCCWEAEVAAIGPQRIVSAVLRPNAILHGSPAVGLQAPGHLLRFINLPVLTEEARQKASPRRSPPTPP